MQIITGKQYPETVLMEEKDVNKVLDKYTHFKKVGFEKAVKTYEVDYLVINTNDNRYAKLKDVLRMYKFLLPVADIQGVIIYEVN